MQNRFLSKGALVAMFALLFFILKNYGLLQIIGLTPDSYKELTDLILGLLIALGIYNNPTEKKLF